MRESWGGNKRFWVAGEWFASFCPSVIQTCFIFSHFTMFYPTSCWFWVHFDAWTWTLDVVRVCRIWDHFYAFYVGLAVLSHLYMLCFVFFFSFTLFCVLCFGVLRVLSVKILCEWPTTLALSFVYYIYRLYKDAIHGKQINSRMILALYM